MRRKKNELETYILGRPVVVYIGEVNHIGEITERRTTICGNTL
jgi:hypothetical protein